MRRREALKECLGVLLLPVLGGALLPSDARADVWDDQRPGRRYDERGRYEGRVDDNGRQYDQMGRYQGRMDDSGRIYDSSGRYQGRIDENGRRYDASGRYQGSVR